MLYLAGIFISFLLTLILVSKKGKTEGDIILSLWLAFICFHFILFYIFISGKFVQFPYLLGFEIPLSLFYGPFLFLYTTSLTQKKRISFRSLLHFIPALVIYLRLVPFYILSSQEKICVYQHEGIGY